LIENENKGKLAALVVSNNAKIRIVNFIYPPTLAFIDNNKKLIVMVLFNNGRRELIANAALAFLADCQDVDGFHGEENEGELIDGP
jgi:undecaprenyl pyrophosphate synthase